MKKKYLIIIGAILVIIALVFSVKHFFLGSYDISFEVTEKQIEERILYNKISNSINEKLFYGTPSDEDGKTYAEKNRKPTDRDGVINEFKRAFLIESILKKEKSAVTYEDAKVAADDSFKLIKTDESSEDYYESIKSAIAEFNITEEKYLLLSYPSAKDLYNETEFGKWFVGSRYYKDNRDPELLYANEYFDKDQQIEEFLKAKIKDIKITVK